MTATTARPVPAQRPCWRIAVIGAGPAGLALALHAARALPGADVTLFDARAADIDISGDPRTLALAQGSVLALQRLGAWPAAAAQAITEVLVSQAPPTFTLPWGPGTGWTYAGGVYRIPCNYQLLIDNLMDLTHETYVHPDSIGQREIDESKPEVTKIYSLFT